MQKFVSISIENINQGILTWNRKKEGCIWGFHNQLLLFLCSETTRNPCHWGRRRTGFTVQLKNYVCRNCFELFGEPSLFQIISSYTQFPVLIPLICLNSYYYSTKAPSRCDRRRLFVYFIIFKYYYVGNIFINYINYLSIRSFNWLMIKLNKNK
jgi:hypothetical protein